jgi:hypothetical protein
MILRPKHTSNANSNAKLGAVQRRQTNRQPAYSDEHTHDLNAKNDPFTNVVGRGCARMRRSVERDAAPENQQTRHDRTPHVQRQSAQR